VSRQARYAELKGALWTDRASFDADWLELSTYLLPRRTRFQTTERNKQRGGANKSILDSTARFAARTLQSGLHAGLTSPSRPWLKLTTPDPDLAKMPAVRSWLYDVTQRMLVVFSQANLYNALPVVYGDLGVFGTGAMAVLEDQRDLFRAYTFPIGSYAVAQDGRGRASTFVQVREMSVEALLGTFGGENGMALEPGATPDWRRFSKAVKDLYDRGNYTSTVKVVWCTKPNDEYDNARGLARNKRFASCWWEDGSSDGVFLRESGFDMFPVMVPRWDVTDNDSYGTDCPGLTALPDVKMLQVMQREKAKAVQKMVNPPLQAPTSLRMQKTSMLPGDVTYVDVREGGGGMRTVHEVNLNLQHLREDINETRRGIQRAFYEDLFLMLAQSDFARGAQPITAREVEERHEEKLLALGPVLERTNDELLDPLVDRVYAMMESAGLIPPAPEALEGVNLRVEYTSIMAQAQKLVGVVATDRFMQTMVPLSEAFPDVRHKVDALAVADEYADILGINPKIVVETELAQAAMAAQAQAMQAQAEAEQAATVAKAMQAAGNTPMEGDTALNRLLSGQSGMSPTGVPATAGVA
jgi:hypothetical protein